jgi:hypothetical protein
MADFTSSYKASGVLSLSDMDLTETHSKKGILTHDLKAALQRFEGQDVAISITLKEEIMPKQVG